MSCFVRSGTRLSKKYLDNRVEQYLYSRKPSKAANNRDLSKIYLRTHFIACCPNCFEFVTFELIRVVLDRIIQHNNNYSTLLVKCQLVTNPRPPLPSKKKKTKFLKTFLSYFWETIQQNEKNSAIIYILLYFLKFTC